MVTTDLDNRRQKEQQFIQAVGILCEELDFPRMSGLILGHLLICDPPYQTAKELLEAVGGSKGSISSMTRLLMHTGLVERTTIIGKRGSYYRIKTGSLTYLLKMRMLFFERMRELTEQGLSAINDTNTIQYERLKEIHDLYAFFENEWPALLERWEKKRSK